MLTSWWLLPIGAFTGLATRTIVGGKAYGTMADALLGITGAFAVDWLLGVLIHATISWQDATLLTIWGAVALPFFAHRWAIHRSATRGHG